MANQNPYRRHPLPLGNIPSFALSATAQLAHLAFLNSQELDTQQMALGVSILNRKYRYEKSRRYSDVYLGLASTPAHSIADHPIPADASRVVLFSQDPQSLIWEAVYFEKYTGFAWGKLYDGVADEEVHGQPGALGPAHKARVDTMMERLAPVLLSDPWFPANTTIRDDSIATIFTGSGHSGSFSLGWAEFMIQGWPVELTTSEQYTDGMAAAWPALASPWDHYARGDDHQYERVRWPEVIDFRFRCIARYSRYKYDLDVDEDEDEGIESEW